jgi:hypothetical protein
MDMENTPFSQSVPTPTFRYTAIVTLDVDRVWHDEDYNEDSESTTVDARVVIEITTCNGLEVLVDSVVNGDHASSTMRLPIDVWDDIADRIQVRGVRSVKFI